MTGHFTQIVVVDFEYETSGGDYHLRPGDLPRTYWAGQMNRAYPEERHRISQCDSCDAVSYTQVGKVKLTRANLSAIRTRFNWIRAG